MVADALNEVRDRIATAASLVGRVPGDVTIVVVSKGRTESAIRAAYEAGQRDFGENRPDTLVERLASGLPDDIKWHFVGTIQRRRLPDVVPGVTLIHSVDRLSLAGALARRDDSPPVLLQVNIGDEPQKHGFARNEAAAAADAVVALGLDVRGLMTIPPRPGRSEDSRRWFEQMRDLREEVGTQIPGVEELSMGMSDDFEVAVECGATIVRLGRAIFGPEASEGGPPPAASR